MFLKTPNIKIKREKLSAFECGFDPNHKIRSAFSLRFFIITVIFLIFDVEVTIIFPIPLGNIIINNITFLRVNLFIYVLLAGGLWFEWRQGALNWSWVCI